jgi:acyl carrier protein
MDQEPFYKEVIAFIAAKAGLPGEVIQPTDHLVQRGFITSLLLAELIVFVENLSGKEIDVENFRLDSFSTIEKIYRNYVAPK